MPDVTPAQILAVVGWTAAQLVAYGLLDPQHEQLAVSIGASVLAAAWKLADAYLRAHRALAVAQNGNLLHPPPAPAEPAPEA